jgi:endonuclease/exonuclease/phosphatase family metal-dependent hydrolase
MTPSSPANADSMTTPRINSDINSQQLLHETGVVDNFGGKALEVRCSDGTCFIRLQNETDRDLLNFTGTQDILSQIDHVRKEQSRHGNAELYHRHWVTSNNNDETVQRKPCHEFSVLQFNALAEGLSAGPSVKKPFLEPNQCHSDRDSDMRTSDGFFGGFTSLPHPDISLNFQLRRWRVLEILVAQSAYDLIALEEIDRYHGFFKPALHVFGYDSVFLPKPESPCVRMGWYSDGCCLFWKRDKFTIVTERKLCYQSGKNQGLIVATLLHIASGKSIIVAVTHLKARRGSTNEQIRYRQVQEMLDVVQQEAAHATIIDSVDQFPILILGDFNADPEEASIRYLLNFNHCNNQGGFARDAQEKESVYKSAYATNDSDIFTSWKIRGSQATRRTIDYIFYRDLSCKATLNIPDAEDLELTKLPGLRAPSDHLNIAAKFCL